MGPFPFGLPSGARELHPLNQRRIVRIGSASSAEIALKGGHLVMDAVAKRLTTPG